ncbi:MAG: hypothetical protein KG003_10810 [Bacteroidetes bacterium]|nr:hypothetical protein [Bacteroidota bacterium]
MEPVEQIIEVQSVLDRLTRFRHLNGWAAVVAGILSLIAYAALGIFYDTPWLVDHADPNAIVTSASVWQFIVAIVALFVIAAVVCGSIILMSLPKDLTKYAWRNLLRLIGTYALYILTGGFIAFNLLFQATEPTMGILQFIPPLMCMMYGLAQFHASHVSLPSLKFLGVWILLCGIIGMLVPSLGWFFWMVGFGPGHILMGIYVLIRSGN